MRTPFVKPFLFAGLLAAFALGSPCRSVAQTPAPTPSAAPAQDAESRWRAHLQDWRTQRDREIAGPDGWLTLVGLEWLKTGINSFGAAPDNKIRLGDGAPPHIGLLTVSGSNVQLLAPREGFPAGLTLDGQPAREGTLSADDTRPSTIAWRGITMVVLPRGGRYALRIKNADSPARAAFRGLHWYPADLRYAVEARWTPYNPPHREKIPTVIDTTLDLPAPGVAEFTLAGKTVRLEPVLESPDSKTLFFILRDTTSQTTTYGGGRFLHTAFPDHGLNQPGTLILDFNQLYNPPCAYTPYATCPLPPEQNRLPIAIEAGEERYQP